MLVSHLNVRNSHTTAITTSKAWWIDFSAVVPQSSCFVLTSFVPQCFLRSFQYFSLLRMLSTVFILSFFSFCVYIFFVFSISRTLFNFCCCCCCFCFVLCGFFRYFFFSRLYLSSAVILLYSLDERIVCCSSLLCVFLSLLLQDNIRCLLPRMQMHFERNAWKFENTAHIHKRKRFRLRHRQRHT